MVDMKLLVEERRTGIDVLATWLPRIALALVFLSVGWQKFAPEGLWVRIFNQIGLGHWFRYATGVMQVGGAVLLLVPRTAAVGFMLLGCTMAGAVVFWIATGHGFSAIIPGALLVTIIGVGWSSVAAFVISATRYYNGH
jgi:uncharacterized membrane protein YphA (DoxX/SURF4 family)